MIFVPLTIVHKSYKTYFMILFYLKKNFCDGWDNLFTLLLFNVVMDAIVIGGYYLVSTLASIPVLSIIILVVCVLALFVFMFAASDCCTRMVNFKSVSIKELFQSLSKVWKMGLLYGAFISVLAVLIYFAIPFYFAMGGWGGIFLTAILCWIVIIGLLALQWFMPLYSQMNGGFKKTLKKCFILLFDNVGFTIFLAIYNLVLLALSFVLVFLMPGFTGLIMAQNNALRLRMYKYDWLEAHPEIPMKQARKQIPWDELLGEDRDTLGPRPLKSFIFPWK